MQLLPNTVICDLMMPRMDGFEFCKAMKTDERTSHIPIIMLTAKANTESRIEGFEIGADDYLTKPFNTEEIQARVKNLLDKQEKLKQYYTNNNSEHTSNTSKTNSIEHAFLYRAKEVVEKHLSHNSFYVTQFSQEMNMSTSQLLRKFKALTNQTVVEFIRDYRLQRASSLLSQGKGNVSRKCLLK
ncbi:MAG: response regulator [Spirosomataceae bacterium]